MVQEYQKFYLNRILTTNSTSTLQDLNYDFDLSGNLTTLTDNLTSNIRSFTYDDLDRLKSAENIPNSSGGYTTLTYQYDLNGNLTQRTQQAQVTQYTYDVENRLISVDNGLRTITLLAKNKNKIYIDKRCHMTYYRCQKVNK